MGRTSKPGSPADLGCHDGVMRKRTMFLGAALAAGVAAAAAARKSGRSTTSDPAKKKASKVFEYTKVEGDFLEVAPVRGSLTKRIPTSAATLFRVLEDADAWPQWLDAIEDVNWTSPLGMGATRTIKLGNMAVDEYFFEWEDGQHMAFRFERSQLPLLEAFAERWKIEPISENECDLTWTYGLVARGPLKVAHPGIAKGISRAGEKWLDQLAEFVTTHAADYQMAT